MLEKLGFKGKITTLISPKDYEGYDLARVISEHKDRYVVQSPSGSFSAEITGNMRFTATSRLDFPAVGDWVKIMIVDSETAIILEVFPRVTVLQRQSVSRHGEIQVIATNVDVAFIVQAVGHDFNLKRLERYLTICYAGDIQPVFIITKTDLTEKSALEVLIKKVKERARDVNIIALSIKDPDSFEQITSTIQPYKSYCFLGSSGVGKSTIINFLKGSIQQKVNDISGSTGKGKHTTTHRELIILENNSIVIDTPGMRELGIIESNGIEQTFGDILAYSLNCRYSDCSHTHESGCAVLQAVKEGGIAQSEYENFMKLKREQMHFSTTLIEKRKKSKNQGKIFKAVKAERRKNKF